MHPVEIQCQAENVCATGLRALALITLCACTQQGSEAPAPPKGAVIGVGPSWILDKEVDRWVDTVALLEPSETRPSWRRKALTNLVLPSKLAALLVPAERQLALGRAEHALQALRTTGTLPDEFQEPLESAMGDVNEVGLGRWIMARGLPLGEWSEILEEAGTFLIMRVLEAPDAADWQPNTAIRIEYVHIPYLRPEDQPALLVEQAREQIRIWAVTPEWEWILPQYYQ
ncbi:MAG TPA: hypothetical protein EYQ74_00095 [Planctomycetes bacterium]|nr:hypothetical protein [Planctomycetota bacterium]HIK60586.1 hypothetical protein [Planctomycetota bacterium]